MRPAERWADVERGVDMNILPAAVARLALTSSNHYGSDNGRKAPADARRPVEQPSIRIRLGELSRYRGVQGLRTEAALASAMGLHYASVNRVLAEKAAPGERFIAGLLAAFPDLEF